MREEGGYQVMLTAIEKLSMKHDEHIAVYGAGNEERLTGLHETAHISKFTYGVANRGASIEFLETLKEIKKVILKIDDLHLNVILI